MACRTCGADDAYQAWRELLDDEERPPVFDDPTVRAYAKADDAWFRRDWRAWRRALEDVCSRLSDERASEAPGPRSDPESAYSGPTARRQEVRGDRVVITNSLDWPPPTGIAEAPPGAPSTMGIK